MAEPTVRPDRSPTDPRCRRRRPIAAVHAEAPSAAETDWREIAPLYELLEQVAPNPVRFTLNRAVALAMHKGPRRPRLLAEQQNRRLTTSHRVPAVRGHLLELAGNSAAAAEADHIASGLTTSRTEREYLLRKAAAIAGSRARLEELAGTQSPAARCPQCEGGVAHPERLEDPGAQDLVIQRPGSSGT